MKSYFSHDSNARNSAELIPLRMKHGAAGYGVFFMLLERLRESDGYMSVKDYNSIAFDLRVDAGLIKDVVENFGLFAFTEDGKCFYSEGLRKRMNKKDAISQKRSEIGKKGAAKRYQLNSAENMENGKIKKNDSNCYDEKFFCHGKIKKNDSNKIKENKRKEKENNKKKDFDFDVAWDLYSKKVGCKEILRKKWDALPQSDKEAALMHIPLYVAATPDKQYRKHFQTYLNNRSWNDEIIKHEQPILQRNDDYFDSRNSKMSRYADAIASMPAD